MVPEALLSILIWQHHVVAVDLLAAHVCSLVLPHPIDWYLVMWGPLKNSELIFMFQKSVCDDLSFVNWCIILLEVTIGIWVYCGHRQMDMVKEATMYIWCSNGSKEPKVCQENIAHTLHDHHHQPKPLTQGRLKPSCMLLCQILTRPSECPSIHRDLFRPSFSNILLSNFGESV